MRHFNIRIVRRGDRYGLNSALVHDKDEPMVEFYDATQSGKPGFSELGQFVARYYIGTLLESPFHALGLNLDGGIPEWTIEPEQYLSIYETLERIVDQSPAAGG